MTGTIRTTIALPRDLLEAVDEAVARGDARGRSDLIARALTSQLAAFRRCRIDEEFAGMADDAIYRREALQVADEFAVSDWEALGGAAGRG